MSNEEIRWQRPALDVLDSDQGMLLVLDVPGVTPEALDVEVEGKQLQVRAPRGDGSGFRRDLQLPDDVDADGIEAKLSDGVLRLTLPRRAEAVRRRIEVV